jgi:hypothetical protein
VTWEKRGLLVPPPVGLAWSASHAAVPHVEVRSDDELRIYFTTRDARGRSHVARAVVQGELEAANVRVAPEPLLRPGEPGLFDDSGAMTSCLVRHAGRHYLYYQGWSLGVTVPFYVYASCAISDDDGESFTRVSPTPILDRTPVDPFWTSSPWVILDEGRWRMWYVSGNGWEVAGESVEHYRVHIRYAESDDGITWRREGTIAIDFAHPGEYAIARPCVVRDDDCYRMWFAYRGQAYRIGYAESPDGVTWTRHDDRAGITVSDSGWDSQMLEYPCVFDYRGDRHMLYNGDGFGRTGIGHAVLAD